VQNGSGQGNAGYQRPPEQTCCEQPRLPGLQSNEHTDPVVKTCRWTTQDSTGRRVYACLTLAEAPGTPARTATAAAKEAIFNTERICMMIPILTEAAYLTEVLVSAKWAMRHTPLAFSP